MILFDLGGVLVEVEGPTALRRRSGQELTDEAIWQRWLLSSSWVQTFERGHCTPEAFAAGIVAEWGLATTTEAFLQDFQGWPTRLLPGVPALLADLASRYTLACVSNTHAVHWPHIRDTLGLDGLLHHYYLSHEIGLIKPPPAIFEHILTPCHTVAIMTTTVRIL